ncbi:hypothetical protein [uncultured Sphingomonas sp.]|uniref:hypothetical protein n=1 Tax=uncultured Sphingomonas sp. TaxID=158754 RepID=UPI0035CA2049
MTESPPRTYSRGTTYAIVAAPIITSAIGVMFLFSDWRQVPAFPVIVIALLWMISFTVAVARIGRRAWWLLLTVPGALFVPAGLIWLLVACNFTRCAV